MRLTVLLDSLEQARAVAEASRAAGVPIPAVVEIDCDGHRSGLRAGDPDLPEVAARAVGGGLMRGVLTHAGESYGARSATELRRAAEQERDAVVEAAGACARPGSNARS